MVLLLTLSEEGASADERRDWKAGIVLVEKQTETV